jgi:dolichol kinase
MLLLLLLPLPLLRSLLSPAFFSALVFFFNPCLFSFLKERESFPQYEYAL